MSKSNQIKLVAKNNGSELVEFVFRNFEVRGGDLTFFYGDHNTPDASYHFKDGHQYEAPYSVAEHIRLNTNYPVHTYKQDGNGKYVSIVGERIQRYGIEPINFIWKTSGPSNLVTVENVPNYSQQISI